MYNKKEREYYNEQRERTCDYLGITKNQYNWLRRKGEELRKIYEDNCNGILSELEYETITLKYERLIRDYAGKLKLLVYFQTDPRGATIYLDKQPIPENNYTQARYIY